MGKIPSRTWTNPTTDLLLLSLCDHITGHIAYALINDLRHGGHNPFGLRAIQTFPLEALHKVMRIKMKFGAALS